MRAIRLSMGILAGTLFNPTVGEAKPVEACLVTQPRQAANASGRQVEVTIIPNSVRTASPKESLEDIAEGAYRSHVGATAEAISDAPLRWRVRMTHDEWPTGDTQQCLNIRRLVISIGYPTTTITLKSDVARDPCRAAAAIRHETEHANINHSTLIGHLRGIEKSLEHLLGQTFPIVGPNSAAARNRARLWIDASIMEVIKPMIAERDKRHQQLDNTELSHRTDRCQNPPAANQ